MERMPVLEELIASGGSKEDLVVLHINHCMDNSFYFNRQLEKTGARVIDMLPVKRTVKKYEIFPAGSQVLLAAFYAARHNSCFSIGVITPKLRCTLMVL